MKLFQRTIPDTSLKWIDFEADGERHFIMFRYTERKGISEVWLEGAKHIKIIDAYPGLWEVIRRIASIIWFWRPASVSTTDKRKVRLS